MSCNYADGLSPYAHKGILGVPERFDSEEVVEEKCKQLVKWMEQAKHVVVHTGAGISTTAGIPDFRGPKGVWTLERKSEKPDMNISFDEAQPTKTHMALCALVEHGYVHYIISQNIDGLHMKSGLDRKYISELHGNIFIEQCNKCRRQFVRSSPAETVGQRVCGGACRANRNERACRGGLLLDNVLDWEHDLPERDLDMSFMHSSLADVNITLGTTLQIIPSGNLPLRNKKHAGKVVICNLQPTKHDKKADLIISTYVDDILTKVCKRLGIEIPDYDATKDPTKNPNENNMEWTLPLDALKEVEKTFNAKQKAAAEQRKVGKSKFTFFAGGQKNDVNEKVGRKKQKSAKEETIVKQEKNGSEVSNGTAN